MVIAWFCLPPRDLGFLPAPPCAQSYLSHQTVSSQRTGPPAPMRFKAHAPSTAASTEPVFSLTLALLSPVCTSPPTPSIISRTRSLPICDVSHKCSHALREKGMQSVEESFAAHWGKVLQVSAPFPLLWASANHIRKGDGLWGPQTVLREVWEPNIIGKMPECTLVPFSGEEPLALIRFSKTLFLKYFFLE